MVKTTLIKYTIKVLDPALLQPLRSGGAVTIPALYGTCLPFLLLEPQMAPVALAIKAFFKSRQPVWDLKPWQAWHFLTGCPWRQTLCLP